MSAIHVRRSQHPRSDDDAPELVFGPYTGTLSKLSSEPDDDDTGLVMPDGTAIRRPVPVRHRLGFLPPDRSVER